MIPVLASDRLPALFPFFVAWDGEGRVRAHGAVIKRMCPDLEVGRPLSDALVRQRGHGPGEMLGTEGDRALVLLSHPPTGTTFRGLVVAAEGDGATVSLFLGSPWLTDPSQLEELSLSVAEFGVHDQVVDLLSVVQVQNVAMQDLRRLTYTLTSQRALLREREAEARKLAAVVSRTPLAVFIADADGRVEWANAAAEELTGWSRAEMAGLYPAAFLATSDTEGPFSDYTALIRRGEPFSAQLPCMSRAHRRFWASVEVSPVRDESGNVTHFTAILQDVTRRRTEERRRQVQYEVSQVLASAESVGDAMPRVVAAVAAGIEWHAGAIWGVADDDARLTCLGYWQHPSVTDDAFEHATGQSRFPRGVGLPGRVWITGEPAWRGDVGEADSLPRAPLAARSGLHDGLAVPLINEGAVVGVFELYRRERDEPDPDLTRTVNALGSQIGVYLVRQWAERERARAKAANRAKSEFLAAMSHEIRTPINGILGMASLLAESPLSPQQREMLSAVQTSGDALLALVEDILDLSRIEAQRLVPAEEPYSLDAVVEGAVDLLAHRAQQKGLELTVIIRADVPTPLVGDSGRVRQVLVNLLGNAVKFTEEGEVVLEIGRAPSPVGSEVLTLSVRDTGVGIESSFLPQLFHVFSQADGSSTRRYGGAGLGLAISKRLVELMGGEIGVESTRGVGSRFWFTLPVREPEGSPSTATPEPISTLSLLVADPSPSAREAVLAALPGVEVRTADTEAAMLRALGDPEWRPDVAIVDRRLFGTATAQALAALDPRPRLLLTGSMTDSVRRRAESIGANVVIAKPIKRHRLTKLLAELSEAPVMPHDAPPPRRADELRGHLLIVEDNEINSRLARLMIERLGYTADLARDGAEAVRAIQRRPYAAVLMDCHMPVMDGYEATQRVRDLESSADWNRPRTWIIAVTANAMVGERERCLECGMDDYVAKPIKSSLLADALARASGPEAPGATTAWTPDAAAGFARALDELVREVGADTASDLIRSWLDDTPARLAELQQLAGSQDQATLRRVAHSLKGSAALFGLPRVQERCAELEALAMRRALDGQHTLVREIFNTWDAVTPALRAMLTRAP